MTPLSRATVCVLALLSGSAHAQSNARQTQRTPRQTAFTHVAVVDVSGGKLLDDQTVVVSGTRISQMGAASSIRVPSGTATVDGRGKFLIPGLWDMHAHVFRNFDSVVTE